MQKCGWCIKRQLLLEKYYSSSYICEHCTPQPAISVPDIAYSLALSHTMLLPKPFVFKYLTKTLQRHNKPHVLLTG